jgi:hypothetical protein
MHPKSANSVVQCGLLVTCIVIAQPGNIDGARADIAVPTVAGPGHGVLASDSAVQARQAREDHDRSGVALAAKASTLGVGIDGVYNIVKPLNLRAEVNLLNLDHQIKNNGNDYDGRLKYLSFGLLADLYPFAGVPVLGAFKLTGGAYVNHNRIGVDANCDSRCNIGNFTVTSSSASNPAHLGGQLDFKRFSPYAGIGFGNAMQGSHWHFAVDAGALFQGSPKVDLAARGMGVVRDGNGNVVYQGDLGSNPQVSANVANEAHNLQSKIKDYKIYPVIGMSLGYRFSL